MRSTTPQVGTVVSDRRMEGIRASMVPHVQSRPDPVYLIAMRQSVALPEICVALSAVAYNRQMMVVVRSSDTL